LRAAPSVISEITVARRSPDRALRPGLASGLQTIPLLTEVRRPQQKERRGLETGAEQRMLEGRSKLLQAHLGDVDDQFHHRGWIRLVKPRHNAPVKFLRIGAPAGFPEKISRGLP